MPPVQAPEIRGPGEGRGAERGGGQVSCECHKWAMFVANSPSVKKVTTVVGVDGEPFDATQGSSGAYFPCPWPHP